LLFGNVAALGATFPRDTWLQALVMEIVMTFFLMLAVVGTAGLSHRENLTALVVGAVVSLDAIFGGPISGASMNPARSLGPALVARAW